MRNWIAVSIGLGLVACGGSQGTEPHDMSAVEHERAAGGEEAAADQHGAQYDPSASTQTRRCAKAVCWTADTNPTAVHQQQMQEHRELAAKHRAAAEALRTAEAGACSGIDEEDRDVSPFARTEDVDSVSELKTPEQHGKITHDMPAGARAVFRAVPGLTAEWLQRVVDCHRARAAAMGFNMSGMEYCPLMLKDVTAEVTSVGNGFAVDVTSNDRDVAREILRRMQAAKAR
jgi:hypothetical protein